MQYRGPGGQVFTGKAQIATQLNHIRCDGDGLRSCLCDEFLRDDRIAASRHKRTGHDAYAFTGLYRLWVRVSCESFSDDFERYLALRQVGT